MALILAHPFRLAGSAVAVVDDGSEAGIAQEIAVIAGTRLGERPLVPSFGVADPVFDGLDVADLNAALQMYSLPGVAVTDVAVDWAGPTTQRAALTFTVDD